MFVLLATGPVAQAGATEVVGMLVGAGVAAVVSFHACCRSSRITAGTWIGSGRCWPG
jgi:hypothetical protein